MKQNKKRGKEKEIEFHLADKIDAFLYEEIKKRMAQNPAVMDKFFNTQKDKNSMEIE